MRPTIYSKRIKSLISEELNQLFINEIFDSKLDTNYDIIEKKIDVFNAIVYRFNTNSNISYDLEFLFTDVILKTKLDDGDKLCNKLIDYDCNQVLNSVDIGFTLTERVQYDDDINNSEYTKNTGLNESIELMGRISFLIEIFIKNNPQIFIYIIGRNTHETKINTYKKIYDNIFNNEFIMFEGDSLGYIEGVMYFINKKILE